MLDGLRMQEIDQRQLRSSSKKRHPDTCGVPKVCNDRGRGATFMIEALHTLYMLDSTPSALKWQSRPA